MTRDDRGRPQTVPILRPVRPSAFLAAILRAGLGPTWADTEFSRATLMELADVGALGMATKSTP